MHTTADIANSAFQALTIAVLGLMTLAEFANLISLA